MLSTFFKGRNPLATARADKRLRALAALTPDKAARLRDEIAACARNDADLRVRRAALAWIDDRELLESLLEDSEITQAAAQRLVSLGLDSDHPAVRQARMRTASSGAEALRIAEGTTEPNALAALFLSCPDACREALLPRVRMLGEQGLSVLERQSRNHDKQVNRTARNELEQLRASSQAVDELCARAEELKAALGRESTDHTAARIHQLRRALEECARGVRDHAQTLAGYGLETPDVEDWQTAAEPAPVTQQAVAPVEAEFDELVAGLKALDDRMQAGEAIDSLQETRDALTDRWLACADHAQPDNSQREAFETVSHRYRELADATERQRATRFQEVTMPPEPEDWPQDPDALQALWQQQRDLERAQTSLRRGLDRVDWPSWAIPPAPLQAIVDTIARLEQYSGRLAEHQSRLEGDLAGLIEQAGSSVADGHLNPARSALGQARKLARSLPEGRVRRHRKALLDAAARVEEMQDWQSFATSPKRQQLVDSMLALAEETPTNAKDRADRIKALRGEWNALGPPTGPGTRSLQSQFNHHAERAFEPCRAHFNEQAELRKHNLAQRRFICEQLQQYVDNVDWSSTDMQAAEQIMRTARSEWRAHHPVDRKHARELENRFEALQERIFARVKAVWDANLAAKEAIVTAAERLAAGDASTAEKISEAKSLQRQWRDVGMTPRKPDQRLWRRFRQQCDLIFEARDNHRKQATSQIESAVAQAEAVCEAMQEAANQANPATADQATLSRLRGELNAIRLPERWERSLHRRFDDIARGYNQLILAGEIERLCNELESLKASDIEVSRAELEGRDPPDAAPVFAERSIAAEEPLTALHRLTLEAELLAGIESPPQDKQLRLEVQVDALNQSMGRRAAEKEPRELADSWCRLGPKSDACNGLRERFFNALLRLARPHDR